MVNLSWFRSAGLLLVVALFMSACSLELSRNEDASLRVEGTMTEAELEAELELGVKDPLVQEMVVDIRDGSIFASTERQHPDNSGVDTLSFRLDLGVRDGHLSADVSEATLNGAPLDQERVARWNQQLATRLERAGGRHPNSELQAVTVGEDAVKMVWRVETPRSRGR